MVGLPRSVMPALEAHRARVKMQWEADAREGLPGVYMPGALDVKNPSAGKSWPWY